MNPNLPFSCKSINNDFFINKIIILIFDNNGFYNICILSIIVHNTLIINCFYNFTK